MKIWEAEKVLLEKDFKIWNREGIKHLQIFYSLCHSIANLVWWWAHLSLSLFCCWPTSWTPSHCPLYSSLAPALAFPVPPLHAWVTLQYLPVVGSVLLIVLFVSKLSQMLLTESRWPLVILTSFFPVGDGWNICALKTLSLKSQRFMQPKLLLTCPISSSLHLSNILERALFLLGLSNSSVK